MVVDARPDEILSALVERLGGGDTVGGSARRVRRHLAPLGGRRRAAGSSALETLTSAGIVMVLPRSGCGIAVTAQIVQYLADSSARQCGPCLFGLDSLAEVMQRVASGRARRSDVARLERSPPRWPDAAPATTPTAPSACSARRCEVFADDLPAHRRGPALHRSA